MRTQILIMAIAVSVCVGQPIRRELRKFVYQEGYPSVRRYPVYPERLSDMKSTQQLTKKTDAKEIMKEPLLPFDVPRNEMENEKEMMITSTTAETTTTTTTTTTTMKPATTPFTTPTASFSLEGGFVPFNPSSESSSASSSTAVSVTMTGSSVFPESPATGNNKLPSSFIDGHDHVFPEAGSSPGTDQVFPDTTEEQPLDASSPSNVFFNDEESTDMPVNTDLERFNLTEEVKMEDSTLSPVEEIEEPHTETGTFEPLSDQTVTESAWETIAEEEPNATEQTL